MILSLYPPIILLAVAAFVANLRVDLRRRRISISDLSRLPLLAMLDLLPPSINASVAVSFGINAYSHVVAFGVLPPTVLAIALCVATWPVFWAEGRKQIQFQRPVGLLFAEWMIFLGSAQIAVTLFIDHSGPQLVRSLALSFPLLLAGGLLVVRVVPTFLNKYEGLRILECVAHNEQFSQPEYSRPTPECPQPELWSMLDSQTTEVEVLEFLKALVTTIKPKLVVETGTFLGHGTMKLAEGIKENGFGKVITVEFDPAIRARAEKRFHDSGLAPWIESRLESSLETNIEETIDLLYSDSHLANREAEIRRLLPRLNPRGLLVIHDASSHFRIVREAALRLEAEGLISAVMLSTPRGVVVAQRREGRN